MNTNIHNLLAQNASSLGPIGTGPGFGPFTSDVVSNNPLVQITRIISVIIGFITICAGIWFMFQLLIGAFGWITSGGDKNKLTQAQDRITNSFIGIVIVVAAYAITALVGKITGLDILDPQKLIDVLKLTP